MPEAGLDIDTLIGIPTAARMTDPPTPRKTMYRRLRALDRNQREQGETPILVRVGRHWKVRVEALRSALRSEPEEEREARIAAVESRVDTLDTRLIALKNTYHRDRRHNERRWKAQQQANDGLMSALQAMRELVALSEVGPSRVTTGHPARQ